MRILLKMKTNKVPNFADLKKHYQDKCKLHPDLAGEESTEAFQEVTEAYRKVFLFIVENPELQAKKATDECGKAIKRFEKTNNVKYNDGSIVFLYDDDQDDFWMENFEKWLGKPVVLSGKKNFIFKISKLENSAKSNLGSVAASVYFQPKSDGGSKIMLQGLAYNAIFTLAVSEILKDMETEKIESSPSLQITDVPEKDDTKSAQKKDVTEDLDMKALVAGFKRLEKEVVVMRENLVRVVNESTEQVKSCMESISTKKEIDNLEKADAANTQEIGSLKDKVDKVIENQDKANVFNSDHLDKFILDSRTTFTKLGDVTSIHTAANEVKASVEMNSKVFEGFVKDSKSMIDKLTEVNENTNNLREDIAKRNTALIATAENTVQAIPVLKSIEEKVSNLMVTLSPLPTPPLQPST